MTEGSRFGMTRRSLLASGAGAAAVSALPGLLTAQPAPRWRRWNVASQQGQAMLQSYQVAIGKLLALPPTDPRNWYRIAFTHFLDCPHGNWWLFPWHRGFTGWVEQIVRQFSGNPNFAFPYWDWTANPQVPAAMANGLLNPNNAAFTKDIKAFRAALEPALTGAGYWNAGSPQWQQLQYRDGCQTSAQVWDQLTNPKNPNYTSFFPGVGLPNVRNPSAQLDCVTKPAVSGATLSAAMSRTAYTVSPLTPIVTPPTAFFSSPKAPHHSDLAGFATLEGQPHNMVHNNTGGIVYPGTVGNCSPNYSNTGGFMQAFLSPVDPLFFLHHSNIDRLWTAWTQKQLSWGGPILPLGPDFAPWAAEPFLFFCNAAGQSLPNAKAGDYATIGAFSYDYQPGSVGVTKPIPKGLEAVPLKAFVGEALPGVAATGTGRPRANAVRVVPDLLVLAQPANAAPSVVTLTLSLPGRQRGQIFPVFVDTGEGTPRVEVGRISLFGHSMPHGPLSFSLPFGPALAALKARGALKPGAVLRFTATAPGRDLAMPEMASMAGGDVPVETVVIEP